jgi:hypothetical protein
VENIALQSLQIYYIDLQIYYIYYIDSKMLAISTRNTKIYKTCELCKAIFFVFYSISRPNLGILLLLKASFREFCYFLLVQRLVYNAN